MIIIIKRINYHLRCIVPICSKTQKRNLEAEPCVRVRSLDAPREAFFQTSRHGGMSKQRETLFANIILVNSRTAGLLLLPPFSGNACKSRLGLPKWKCRFYFGKRCHGNSFCVSAHTCPRVCKLLACAHLRRVRGRACCQTDGGWGQRSRLRVTTCSQRELLPLPPFLPARFLPLPPSLPPPAPSSLEDALRRGGWGGRADVHGRRPHDLDGRVHADAEDRSFRGCVAG